MKKMCRVALVLGVAVLIASPALAQRDRGDRPRGERPQGGGFGGGSLFLLTQESVQKDLKLSDEQVTKIKEVQQKQRESFQGLRDLSREERRTKMQEQAKATEKAIKDVLKPEQEKRLKQITLQREGARALNHKEVAEALKLSDEQKDKIKTIQEDAGKEMREARQGGNNEDARKKVAEIRKSTNEKVMNVLTSEQKAKLKEISGEPFTGEIKRPEFPGRGRGDRQSRR